MNIRENSVVDEMFGEGMSGLTFANVADVE